MLTKAYVVADRGSPFELVDVQLDELQANEVLVEMLYTGVCHTVSISARCLSRPVAINDEY
jgi:Zn-dependent alcohol dehydrogenase